MSRSRAAGPVRAMVDTVRLGDPMAAADLAAVVDELASAAAERTFIRGEAAMVSVPPASLLVDCVDRDGAVDVLLTARPRARTGALLCGTQVLVVPDTGPVRHGRVGPTGQLRVRGLASAGFRMRLRPALWLDGEPLPLGDGIAGDLGLVVVRGSWPGPAPRRALSQKLASLDADPDATTFESADGTVLVELHEGPARPGKPPPWALQVSGREGDAMLDGRTVHLRLGFGPQPVGDVPIRLAWDGFRCWGHFPLGPADIGTMTLGIPDTAPAEPPSAPPDRPGDLGPAEARQLVALATAAGQDREARLAALDLLAMGAPPEVELRPLLGVLAGPDTDAELGAGAAAVLGAARAGWAVAPLAGQLAAAGVPVEVKQAAAAALARVLTADARAALHRALRDADGRVRLVAALALEGGAP